MQSIQGSETPSSRVSALFANTEVSFSLSKGATFADLADSFDLLGDRGLGRALAIYLRLGGADEPSSVLRSGV
jgi:hypothetical protein